MHNWTTVSRATILDHSKFLRVENHVVELPDGRVIEEWPWIITPDFTNTVAITAAGKYLIFRQTKYAIDGPSLAPVGGYIEAGEEPLTAAKRELLEETGYVAEEWLSLGTFAVDGNRGAGKAFFFLARRATPRMTAHADDLEEQELLLLSKTEVETALRMGDFKLLPWASIMALALTHQAGQGVL